MDMQGQYFVRGEFVAMRDEYHSSWRISKITINPDTSLTLTYLETAYDKMEAQQVMDKANESDNREVSNTDDVIRPLYYV